MPINGQDLQERIQILHPVDGLQFVQAGEARSDDDGDFSIDVGIVGVSAAIIVVAKVR